MASLIVDDYSLTPQISIMDFWAMYRMLIFSGTSSKYIHKFQYQIADVVLKQLSIYIMLIGGFVLYSTVTVTNECILSCYYYIVPWIKEISTNF
jgi:hypothetical protein